MPSEAAIYNTFALLTSLGVKGGPIGEAQTEMAAAGWSMMLSDVNDADLKAAVEFILKS